MRYVVYPWETFKLLGKTEFPDTIRNQIEMINPLIVQSSKLFLFSVLMFCLLVLSKAYVLAFVNVKIG